MIDCLGPVTGSGLGNAYKMHTDALSTIVPVDVKDVREAKGTYGDLYYHGNPSLCKGLKASGRSIAFWVCESDDLPDACYGNHEKFTNLWVPSTYCKNVFEERLQREVQYVPHCATRFNYSPVKNSKPIIVTSFDGHSRFERKNVIDTITAVNRAFGADCRLIVKCRNLCKSYQAWMEQVAKDTPMTILGHHLSTEELDKLYMMADIYVALHCAEGFGLQLLEAMACGCKVVATDYSGNVDFMDHHNSYPVSYDLCPATDSFFKGNWARPNLDDAVRQLQCAAEGDFSVNELAFKTALSFSISNTIYHTLKALNV